MRAAVAPSKGGRGDYLHCLRDAVKLHQAGRAVGIEHSPRRRVPSRLRVCDGRAVVRDGRVKVVGRERSVPQLLVHIGTLKQRGLVGGRETSRGRRGLRGRRGGKTRIQRRRRVGRQRRRLRDRRLILAVRQHLDASTHLHTQANMQGRAGVGLCVVLHSHE